MSTGPHGSGGPLLDIAVSIVCWHKTVLPFDRSEGGAEVVARVRENFLPKQRSVNPRSPIDRGLPRLSGSGGLPRKNGCRVKLCKGWMVCLADSYGFLVPTPL